MFFNARVKKHRQYFLTANRSAETRSIFDRPPEPGDTVRGVSIDSSDGDASAPRLLFFARTCVSHFGGNSCVEGVSKSRNVTVCKTYCTDDGCNAGKRRMEPMGVLVIVATATAAALKFCA